jgi:cytochrome P450
MNTINSQEILFADLPRHEDIAGPQGRPILGNMLQLKKNSLHNILENWAHEFGSVYKIRLGKKPMIILSDTALIREILSRRPKDFRRRVLMEEAAESMGINGLFTTDGDNWTQQRKIVMEALDAKHLTQFFPILLKVTHRLKERWQKNVDNNQSVNVQEDTRLYTIDLMSYIVFGYDMNALGTEKTTIVSHLNKILQAFNSRINSPLLAYWKYFKLPADFALENSLKEIRQLFLEVIVKSRQRLIANPELAKAPQNVLEGMLVAYEKEGIFYSDDEIFAKAFSIWLTGEGVAVTLAWTMHFISETADSKISEVQRNIQAEVDSILAESESFRNIQQTSQLSYIEAVLLESIRLKPVAPMISVQAKHEVALGKLILPESSILLLLPRINALEDKNFYRAAEFCPDRWLSKASDLEPHNSETSMPFGSGPRRCAGSHLALLAMKMFVTTLGKNFHVVKSDPSQQIHESYVFLMEPENFKVALSDRKPIAKLRKSD